MGRFVGEKCGGVAESERRESQGRHCGGGPGFGLRRRRGSQRRGKDEALAVCWCRRFCGFGGLRLWQCTPTQETEQGEQVRLICEPTLRLFFDEQGEPSGSFPDEPILLFFSPPRSLFFVEQGRLICSLPLLFFFSPPRSYKHMQNGRPGEKRTPSVSPVRCIMTVLDGQRGRTDGPF